MKPSAELLVAFRRVAGMAAAEGIGFPELIEAAHRTCRARGPDGTCCIKIVGHSDEMHRNELGQSWPA